MTSIETNALRQDAGSRQDVVERFRVSRLVGGVMLVVVGGILTLQSAGFVRVGRLGDFWPLLLVWVGLSRMLGPGRSRHFVSGAVVVALGVIFLADRFHVLSFSLHDFWPLLLIVAGIALVAEGLRLRRADAASDSSATAPGSLS